MTFQIGNKFGKKFKKGSCPNPNGRPKGIPMSVEAKQKIRISHLGKKYKSMSIQGKENISKAHIGLKGNWTGKKRIHMTGEKHFNWKGGKTLAYLRKTADRPKPQKCEICGRDGRVCFDHDHKTNKFRGWICDKCNFALGLVGDSKEILTKMIEYLSK